MLGYSVWKITILAPPYARHKFFKCAPLTWNPGSPLYKTRYKYFRSGIMYAQNWRVCELLKMYSYLDIPKSFKWKESFIFRYFKVFQVSQIFTCGLSDLLLRAVGSLAVFVLREYIFKSSHTRQFWENICHTIYFCNNTIIVQVRYIIIEAKKICRYWI
jgi:hypothetical protein